MDMGTSQILRYKRPVPCWVCRECESENTLTLGRCHVCGAVKATNAPILKAWTPADDMAPTPPPARPAAGTATPYSGPIFRDAGRGSVTPTDSLSSLKVIWGIVIAVIIIALIATLADAKEPDCRNDIYSEDAVLCQTAVEQTDFDLSAGGPIWSLDKEDTLCRAEQNTESVLYKTGQEEAA